MSHGDAEVDWAALLDGLRRGRRLLHPTMTAALDWVGVPAGGTVADVGCGAGGVAVELAHRVGDRGRVFAVDGEDALLAETAVHAGQEGVGERVKTLQTDLDDVTSTALAGLPPLDLLWASAVVHHLADQQAAVARLVSLLAPGGRLLLAEGGLPTTYLPWDLGVGAPGLEERLHHAHEMWFAEHRAGLEGVVRMPYGWAESLRRAGLRDVESRSFLLDRPAPDGEARDSVVASLQEWVERAGDRIVADDRAAWEQLLDPQGEAFLGRRNDLVVLAAVSVHRGTA